MISFMRTPLRLRIKNDYQKNKGSIDFPLCTYLCCVDRVWGREECYYVKDIAKDIYDKFHARGSVKLSEIYQYLDEHPIFPSDGYKQDIKRELKVYAKVPKSVDGDVVFIQK